MARRRPPSLPAARRRSRSGRPRRVVAPRPGVAEPERRQEVQRRGSGPRLVDRDPDGDVLGRRLGVLDDDVEVAVVVEDARCRAARTRNRLATAARVRRDEVVVRVRGLRVLVQVAQVRVRRRRVEVEVVLLDVLAVVALAVRQPEQALLEDRVAAVPERQREAQPLPVVREAGEPVLAPAVGARPRLVVAEVAPGVAVVGCSPRGPCPTAARTGTAPSAATARPRRAPRSGGAARHPGSTTRHSPTVRTRPLLVGSEPAGPTPRVAIPRRGTMMRSCERLVNGCCPRLARVPLVGFAATQSPKAIAGSPRGPPVGQASVWVVPCSERRFGRRSDQW